MRSRVRLLVAVPLLGGGVLLALYGAFAILYDGDCSGDCGAVTVTLGGRGFDADAVGWTVLAIAVVCVATGVTALRRRR